MGGVTAGSSFLSLSPTKYPPPTIGGMFVKMEFYAFKVDPMIALSLLLYIYNGRKKKGREKVICSEIRISGNDVVL